MHIKFLRHSTGSGRALGDYLKADTDHKGERRELVRVMRGDPDMVADLIDSIDRKHKYKSGVMAWDPGESVTDEQMEEAVNELERLAFAGLDPNDYSWCVIRHDNHIHFVSAMIHLPSDLQLNIAPPGWEKIYDPLRDHLNWKHGWTRPDDPERMKDLQPGDRIRTEDWAKGEDVRQVLTRDLTAAIAAGDVPGNRAGVVAWLSKRGEIKRQTKDGISILLPGAGRNIRLKGRLFSEAFDGLSWDELLEQRRLQELRRAEMVEETRQRLEEVMRHREQTTRDRWKQWKDRDNERQRKRDERNEEARRLATERDAAAEESARKAAEFAKRIVRAPSSADEDKARESSAADRAIGAVSARDADARGNADKADRAVERSGNAAGAAECASVEADRAAERAHDVAIAGLRQIAGRRDQPTGADAEQPGYGGIAAVIGRIRDLVQRAHEQLIEWLKEQIPDDDQSRERPGG